MRLTPPFNLPALGRRQSVYVVVLTLHRPVLLINSRMSQFSAALTRRAPLIPKLRGQFAEFLNSSSSERLRILIPPTCVGLRYGRLQTLSEDFI